MSEVCKMIEEIMQDFGLENNKDWLEVLDELKATKIRGSGGLEETPSAEGTELEETPSAEGTEFLERYPHEVTMYVGYCPRSIKWGDVTIDKTWWTPPEHDLDFLEGWFDDESVDDDERESAMIAKVTFRVAGVELSPYFGGP